MAEVLGRETALAYMQDMSTRHYRWVYRTILQDLELFDDLFSQHGVAFS